MKRFGFLSFIAVVFFVLAIGCSERSALLTNNDIETSLSASSIDGASVYYWEAVDWDGTSSPEPNTFYRIVDITSAKSYFSGDTPLLNWMNSLPQLDNAYANRNPSAETDQVLKVTVSDAAPQISDVPVLAALGWSAVATITPLSGGSVARCNTTTTNPAVSGLKSHQIWLFNQNGYIYYGNYWNTTDLLEHSVNFQVDRNMACDSTLYCLGRIVKDGNVMALDTDIYTRSCN